jgi:hypothetical protein
MSWNPYWQRTESKWGDEHTSMLMLDIDTKKPVEHIQIDNLYVFWNIGF